MLRNSVTCATLALAAATLFAPAIAHGQSAIQAVDQAGAKLAPPGWTTPRTPDGAPDLQGIYTNVSVTPLQRPKDLGDKEFFTPAEAVAWKKARLTDGNKDRRDGGAVADLTRAYNDVFWDSGSEVSPTLLYVSRRAAPTPPPR